MGGAGGASWGEWLSLTAETLGQRWLTRRCPPLREIAPGGADLSGHTAVVTGPTSGIGTTTAGELMRRGCHGEEHRAPSAPAPRFAPAPAPGPSLPSRPPPRSPRGSTSRADCGPATTPAVILACRSVERGERTLAALEAALRTSAADPGAPEPCAPPSAEVMELDVGELSSVRAFAAAVERRGLSVDFLVNNAGVYLMGERARRTTREGRESHLATNFLGPALLSLLLLPALGRAVRAGGARIVNVSSKMHEFGRGPDWDDPGLARAGAYSAFRAYANSKLAQLQFAAEFRRRLRSKGAGPDVEVLAVHPGMVITGVANTLPRWMQWAYRNCMQVCLLLPEEGARATVHACCAPGACEESAGTGGYFTFNAEALAPAPAALDPAAAGRAWDWALEEFGPEGLPGPARALATA